MVGSAQFQYSQCIGTPNLLPGSIPLSQFDSGPLRLICMDWCDLQVGFEFADELAMTLDSRLFSTLARQRAAGSSTRFRSKHVQPGRSEPCLEWEDGLETVRCGFEGVGRWQRSGVQHPHVPIDPIRDPPIHPPYLGKNAGSVFDTRTL